jgi:hypothetical protein
MTVFSWQRAKRPGKPADGAWWAADVKFCVTKSFGDLDEPASNLLSQFRVELVDGRALTPEVEARTPDEVYAQPTQRAKAGKCLRGDVVVDVPTRPAAEFFSATVSSFGWQRWSLS